MKYTLDLSGHDENGSAGIDRLGGLFASIEDAVMHGRQAAKVGRFHFRPEVLWVRDEEGETIRQDKVDQ